MAWKQVLLLQREKMMSKTSEVDRLVILMEEIAHAKSQLLPQDTGHIHTAINWMESRVEEIKEKLKR